MVDVLADDVPVTQRVTFVALSHRIAGVVAALIPDDPAAQAHVLLAAMGHPLIKLTADDRRALVETFAGAVAGMAATEDDRRGRPSDNSIFHHRV